jgi:hypothetical protein
MATPKPASKKGVMADPRQEGQQLRMLLLKHLQVLRLRTSEDMGTCKKHLSKKDIPDAERAYYESLLRSSETSKHICDFMGKLVEMSAGAHGLATATGMNTLLFAKKADSELVKANKRIAALEKQVTKLQAALEKDKVKRAKSK